MRFNDCPTCAQSTMSDERPDERHLLIECRGECDECWARRYGAGEHHESVRLFEPAPPVMRGQTGMGI
jgi:transcriptional regulator NrdR family protein